MIVRRAVLVVAVSAVVLGFVGCSSSDDDDGAPSDDSAADATTTTAFEVAAEDEALCEALAAADEEDQVLGAVIAPSESSIELVQGLADAAPADLAATLEGFVAARQTIIDAEAQVEATGGDPAAIDALSASYGGFDSADARAQWLEVLTFADERCQLEVPGLEVARDAAAPDAGSEEARAAVAAIDPALDAAIQQLSLTKDDEQLAEVYVVVDPAIGQDGALRLCEALSTHVYGELAEDRAQINIESADGAFYVFRFSEPADCQV